MATRLQVWRQDGAKDEGRWEFFAMSLAAGDSLEDALRAIAAHPVTEDGARTRPIEYRAARLDGSMGECAVLVNGFPRLPSRTQVASLGPLVVVSPLSKFPVVRDLAVDLSEAAATFKSIRATLPPTAEAPRAAFDACLGCAACLEACPQFGRGLPFVGPAVLAEVARWDGEATGRKARLAAMVAPGGVASCGNAQVCVEVCPAEIPLATAIGRVKRAATAHWIRSLWTE